MVVAVSAARCAVCKMVGVHASLLAVRCLLASYESERFSVDRNRTALFTPSGATGYGEPQVQEGVEWISQSRLRRLRVNWACCYREWARSARRLWLALSWCEKEKRNRWAR